MRDKQTNIYDFYKELADIHANSWPDQRPGQFLMNVFHGIQCEQNHDVFFPESQELLEWIKKYISNHTYNN